MKCLVIVESPSKCKIITNYLNSIPELVALYGTFTVIASCGHIRDLKKSELSIDIANNFTPTYEVLCDPFKKKLVSSMKKQIVSYMENKDMILLATDSDSEGTAISWHICDYFKLKPSQYKRIIFNEITKNALKHAVLHAGSINMHDVDAQETRRILDRIVGYQVSPLLWTQFNQNKLSAGRVQSAALKIIVERNNTIDAHIYTPYWRCNATFKLPLGNVKHASAKNTGLNDIHVLEAYHTNIWDSYENAVETITKHKVHLLAQISWNVIFKETQRKKSPPPPLITSTLQQECFKRFKMNSKSTMMTAQQLYEAGYITYMRTDSTTLSEDAQKSICAYITSIYGVQSVCARTYKTKNSSSQEAHEAIRPTHVENTVVSANELNSTHQKVYNLIWKYAIASQMVHALYTDVTYTISHYAHDDAAILYSEKECTYHIYAGKTSILMSPGYMTILMPETQASPDTLKMWEVYLHKSAQSQDMCVTMQSFAINGDVHKPPSYFNEASFVKTLEKEGIGRPSTYAAVVNKLYDKQYIVKGTLLEKNIHVANASWNSTEASILHNITNELKVCIQDPNDIVVTPIGKEIVTYISSITPYLIDVTFTKHMETDLDKIASAQSSKQTVLSDFYEIFSKSIHTAKQCQTPLTNSVQKPQSKLDVPLKDFPEMQCSIVNTKYGPALYQKSNKTFHSLMPLLEWRKVSIEDTTIYDVKFILSLPHKISTIQDTQKYGIKTCVVCLGRYGLYLQIDGKNVGLHPDLWQNAYNGSLTYASIHAKPAPAPVYVNKTYTSNTNAKQSKYAKKPFSKKDV